MTLLKDITDCSTYSVHGLDNQLIWVMNQISPGLLVKIDDLANISLGQAVHPWMQSHAKDCLKQAIALRKQKLIVNSAYRTLAGQQLLRFHYENNRCGITAAAPPGLSNHNNASAVDIEDPYGWRSAFEACYWQKLGDFDPMHYDCVHPAIENINSIAVLAFQKIWNQCHPNDHIPEDGDFGPVTASRLSYAPAEGFAGIKPYRTLCLTQPLQVGDDVGKLQLALRAAGIPLAKADKVFGEDTAQAVKMFQGKKGLVADGVVGDFTRQVLGLSS